MSLALTFGFLAALANVLGGAIVSARVWGQTTLRYFVAVGSGFMLGAVFVEMLPESLKLVESATWFVLAGYLLVHMFEHTFASHLHFGEETHHEELVNPVVGISAFVGLLVHTFFDGVAIGSSLEISRGTGVLIFLAVLLHKIPDGFTVSSILQSAGHSRMQSLGAAATLGLSTLAGVAAVGFAGPWLPYALPLSTGSTLYVAASDLMPEVNREPGVGMAVMVFAGTAMFLAVRGLVQ